MFSKKDHEVQKDIELNDPKNYENVCTRDSAFVK